METDGKGPEFEEIGSRAVVTTDEDVFVNIVDDDTAAQLEAGMRMLPGPSGIAAHGTDSNNLVFEEAQFLEEDTSDFVLQGQIEPITEEVYEGDEPVAHFLVEDISHDEYMMFQAEELPSGLMLCKLCKDSPLFQTREAFAAHRYRVHGSYTNSLACPEVECTEMFASITIIKRHLITHHEVPLETHYKKFENQADFNDWILFVQYATNSRFVLVNRQQPKRRQILYCEYSEHRRFNTNEELQTMIKPRACCPAHINFQVLSNGNVSVIFQLKHHGHIPDSVDINSIKPFSLLRSNSDEKCRVAFAPSCPIIGYRPMQFIQIDMVPMDSALYKNGAIYTHILIVTDMFSKFIIAKPLIEAGETNDRLVYRLLLEIFNMFGIPEGYSSICSDYKRIIDNTMTDISSLFRVNIIPVTTNTPSYSALKQSIEVRAEAEMQTKARWPEILPSVVLSHNQTPHPGFQYRVSPFEVMFGRRAWYRSSPQLELPWLVPDEVIESNYEAGLSVEEILNEYPSLRKTDGEAPILDIYGDELSKALTKRVQSLVNMIEQRCDKWESGEAFMPAKDDPYFLEKVGIKNEFIKSDPVLVRNVFTHEREKHSTIKGVVGGVDWENAPFAYKIHITPHLRANKIPGVWPDETCPAVWLSAFDVVASDNELHVQRIPNIDQRRLNLFCQCSLDCPLVKSEYCIRSFSNLCCSRVRPPCEYHDNFDPATASIEKYTELFLIENEEKKKKTLNAAKRRKTMKYYARPVIDRRNGLAEENFEPSASEVDVETIENYPHAYRIEEEFEYAPNVQEMLSVAISADPQRSSWRESQDVYEHDDQLEEIYKDDLVEHRVSPSSSYCMADEFLYMGVAPGGEEDPKEWVSKLNLRQCASRLRRIELRMNALQTRNDDPKSSQELMELDRLAKLLRKHWSELQKTAPKSFRLGFSRAFQGISKVVRKRPVEFENYVTTKYVVEGGQVFPLVYQPSEPEALDQGGPVEQVILQSTQPSRGRGILSRRGPSKKTAQSVRDLVSASSTTYTEIEPDPLRISENDPIEKPQISYQLPIENVRRSTRTTTKRKAVE